MRPEAQALLFEEGANGATSAAVVGCGLLGAPVILHLGLLEIPQFLIDPGVMASPFGGVVAGFAVSWAIRALLSVDCERLNPRVDPEAHPPHTLTRSFPPAHSRSGAAV